MYFRHTCPVCRLELTSDGEVIEHFREGDCYRDIAIEDSCAAYDLKEKVLRYAESLIKDGMSVKELCRNIMVYFNAGPDLACDLTRHLLYNMRERVLLPDRRRIKIIA